MDAARIVERSALPPRLRAEGDAGPRVLYGHMAVWNTWARIDNEREGPAFLERISPGAFVRAFGDPDTRSRMRVMFEHGKDPSIGRRPLGRVLTLEEDGVGARYEVAMFSAEYARSLIEPLEAGQLGSSFRFRIVEGDRHDRPGRSSWNPDGLPEVVLRDVEPVEFGPVVWPAYETARAGIRSLG